MYGAEVQTTVTPLERNRVGINIEVTEGEVAKIRGINIVGAQAFSESELLSQFVLRTPGWLTWYTKHDQYSRRSSRPTWRRCARTTRTAATSTSPSSRPRSRSRRTSDDIYITVNITEGESYTVSDVKLSGQLLGAARGAGEAGAAQARRRVLAREAGREHQGDQRPPRQRRLRFRQRQRRSRTSTRRSAPSRFNIVVDPGRRVYVRRINIAGNTKTRDEVVRREMRQLEGACYDASKIQLSRRRIERTGYFSESTSRRQPVEGSPTRST